MRFQRRPGERLEHGPLRDMQQCAAAISRPTSLSRLSVVAVDCRGEARGEAQRAKERRQAEG